MENSFSNIKNSFFNNINLFFVMNIISLLLYTTSDQVLCQQPSSTILTK